MKKIFILATLMISSNSYSQLKFHDHINTNTTSALNYQLWASEGFEIKSNFEPFMDLELWDKDTDKNKIVFKNTKDIKIEDSGANIAAKKYEIELNYENINSDKKVLESMYNGIQYTHKDNPNVIMKTQSITKLKNNKIVELTGCSASGGIGDATKLDCSTTSKSLCDYIAKRSENFFKSKSDARKCTAYATSLLTDLIRDQKNLAEDLDKTHKENVLILKSKGPSQDQYNEEDNGLIGMLKRSKIDVDTSNLMGLISSYQAACSLFNMHDKESGRTRSLHQDEEKSTKKN